jgi:hypothetical protein
MYRITISPITMMTGKLYNYLFLLSIFILQEQLRFAVAAIRAGNGIRHIPAARPPQSPAG